jgi:putative molybdopterin biosynthesis protein
MSEYLTVPEAAEHLRISVRKVYDLVSRSRLPHRRAGGRLLFERESLTDWLRSSGPEHRMAAPPVVLAGSHDALMDWAVRASHSTMAVLCRGSRDGLERLRRREACAALLHLPGRDAGRTAVGGASAAFNLDAVAGDFAGQDVVLLNWCWRQQGLMVARGNPLGIARLGDLCVAGERRPRVGRRSRGAGSRELFDRMIDELGPAGGKAGAFHLAVDDLESENDAAIAVQHGQADAVFGAQSAAQSFGLGFVPVVQERVDLLVNRRSYFEPPLQSLLGFCRTPAFVDYAAALGGYDLTEHGRVVWNAP